MTDINRLMAGLYGESDEPVTVFDKGGRAVWKNALSEKIYTESAGAEKRIYQEITVKERRSGSFSECGGGKYRFAVIEGSEYIIVHHYREGRLRELFEEKSVSDFAASCDSSLREAVTCISASCEMLEDMIDIQGNEAAELCLEGILKSCCTVMRSTAVITQLAAAAGEKLPRTEALEICVFVKEFARSCKNAAGRDIHAEIPQECERIINSDRLQLTYLLLMAVRKAISESSEGCGIGIRLYIEENTAVIEITADEAGVRNEHNHAEEYKYKIRNDIMHILADRLEAEITVYRAKIRVALAAAEPCGEINFRSEKIFFTDGYFSPYRIMLGDLEDNS